MYTIENMIIKNTSIIKSEDYGCIIIDFTLEGDGIGVSLAFPIVELYKIFEVTGVKDYDRIKGSAIRVKFDGCVARSIGHIVKNIWYSK